MYSGLWTDGVNLNKKDYWIKYNLFLEFLETGMAFLDRGLYSQVKLKPLTVEFYLQTISYRCHWYRPHPYQSRAVGGLISSYHEGHLAAHFIINQIHNVPYWQPIECNKQCYLIALMKHLHVLYHPFGPPSGLGWANVMGPARSVGTEFEKGGYLVCPPLLHAILLCPPNPPCSFSSTWKLTEGMLLWSQPLTWFFDQWLVPLKGLFQHCSSFQPPHP